MLPDTPFDTIAAVSTPPGEGGIGIVRLSGPESFAIIEKIFHPYRKNAVPRGFRTFTMRLGCVKQGERTIDEALVSLMRAPHSYTREDVAEINCHGGAVAVNEVLRCVLASGARLAGPGEFTTRAFINGRIDLAQAEAVLDIVKARTGRSLDAALAQLKGGLSEKAKGIAESLKEVLVALEASIDFADEEDVPEASPCRLVERISSAVRELDALIASYDRGKVYRDGVLTALVGKPNVGKSSILNAFLKFDRAIVTPIPGTTRDVIEEQLNLGGVPFILADTAGITESENQIEKEGVRRSLSYIDKAGLVLLVFDGSSPLDERDVEIALAVKGRLHILLLNKSDLPLRFSKERLFEKTGVGPDFVLISAKNGAGLKDLESRMTDCVVEGRTGGDYSLMVTNTRHFTALSRAREELMHSLEAIEEWPAPAGRNTRAAASKPAAFPEPELVAYDVRSALDVLGEITGEVTNAEILDAIFSGFCIGK